MGLLIVAIVMIDVFWSTLSTNGAGPISDEVTSLIWRIFRMIHRRRQSHNLLKLSSVIILVMVFGMWILLLWTGWTVIFISSADAVLVQETQEPAAIRERIYFVGMTLFTLGTGDLVAGGSGWRLMMSIAAFNGLLFTTLVITYLLPVVSAAVDRRQLALSIWGLGESAEQILVNGWNDGSFQQLEDQLHAISMLLLLHAERHLAYPVLQYFHASDPRADLSPRIATLDDATSLLEFCVSPDARLTPSSVRSMRQALDCYFRRVAKQHIYRADEPPPLPDFDRLRKAEIPLCDDETMRAGFLQNEDRRRLSYGLLRGDAWHWGD